MQMVRKRHFYKKYICNTLIEVEKSIKECLDPHTCLIQEYRNVLPKYDGGKIDIRSFKGRQSGSGIAGMYSKKPYMIPVNPHITVEESKEIFGKQVTPMAAVEERAKKKN